MTIAALALAFASAAHAGNAACPNPSAVPEVPAALLAALDARVSALMPALADPAAMATLLLDAVPSPYSVIPPPAPVLASALIVADALTDPAMFLTTRSILLRQPGSSGSRTPIRLSRLRASAASDPQAFREVAGRFSGIEESIRTGHDSVKELSAMLEAFYDGAPAQAQESIAIKERAHTREDLLLINPPAEKSLKSFYRRRIATKRKLADRLESLIPWSRLNKAPNPWEPPDRKERLRWRAYLEALRRPAPLSERVLVYRQTDRDSILRTKRGPANISYFLVYKRGGHAGAKDIAAACADIWSRLGGTATSIGLHVVDRPMEQTHPLRSSPWISITHSFKRAPSFRGKGSPVEAILIDPRMLFPVNGWTGESEAVTPFLIWPEDIVATFPAEDFSPESVRSALRRKFGAAAEELIQRKPALREI